MGTSGLLRQKALVNGDASLTKEGQQEGGTTVKSRTSEWAKLKQEREERPDPWLYQYLWTKTTNSSRATKKEERQRRHSGIPIDIKEHVGVIRV